MDSPPQHPLVTLVLGGARSGKSRHAERLVEGQPGDCIYLATAEAGDAEMAERIRRHRARRGSRWRTVEEPLDVPVELGRQCGPDRAILLDCLTLWLSNLMAVERPVEAEIGQLVDRLGRLDGPVVLVSNEVGHGIVPDNPSARAFRDYAGQLHQAVAAAAECVVFMVAGLPTTVKTPEHGG